MEQKWGAVCVERRKHGSGRGLRKPALVIMQGGAFLLYYVGNGKGSVLADLHEKAEKTEQKSKSPGKKKQKQRRRRDDAYG